MCKRFRFIYQFFILAIIFCSCQGRKVTLCSPNEEYCLTIKDSYNSRFIYFDSNSKDNFVELDITNADLETEGIFVCWKANTHEIEIVNPKVVIVSQHYDEALYSFSNVMDKEVKEKPSIEYFHQENCFEFNILTNSVFPKEHAILKN